MSTVPPKRTRFAGMGASFGYAWRGLRIHFATQPNARLHLLAAIAVCAAGWWWKIAALEWCAVVGAIGLVWTVEALNTALEFYTDLVSPELHPLAGKAKDVAAGAVLAASVTSATIGAIIFVPKIAASF